MTSVTRGVEDQLGRSDEVEDQLGRINEVEDQLGRSDEIEDQLGRSDNWKKTRRWMMLTIGEDATSQ